MTRGFNKEDYKKKEVLQSLLKEGLTPSGIGEIFDIHRANISCYIKKNGLSWQDYNGGKT